MEFCNKYQFEIIDISWERIFMNLKIRALEPVSEPVTFSMVSFLDRSIDRSKAKLEGNLIRLVKDSVSIIPNQIEQGIYSFRINITSINRNEFLENGIWKITVQGKDGASIVGTSHALGYCLDELSRVFRYDGGKYAYNMSFNLNCYDGEKLELCFHSNFMIRNTQWKRRRYVKEALTFKGKFRRMYMYAVIILIRMFYHTVAFLTPKNGTRVLMMTETKDYLWGNLKYIDTRIKERGLDQQFKVTYSCRKSVGQHRNVMSWVKTVWSVARQDYIFVDDYAPLFGFFKLCDKTKLIQVWHAGEGFKSVGYSRFGKDGSPFPSKSCHKAYSYALTGAKNLIEVYEEVFGLEKSRFLPVGMARLDDFLDQEKIDAFRREFYQEYPNLNGKKIILFAPTFRGTGQKVAYYDYDKLDLNQLYDFCGEEYVVLFKMHPFVQEPIEIPEKYRDRLFDFAAYPNINDLYYVTEILITDYSSNYYEYALMRKPALFFTYDREMYELTRGVHRSVKEHAPGKVCDSFDELMEALRNRDYEIEKMDRFIEENFGEYDGHACDRVIDQILLKKENKNEC